MSASNKKKLRKEQNMAQMTERQRKEAKELKKIRAYTLTFWIVLALCLCIVLTTVLSTPVVTLLTRNTDAVTVGNHTLSAVELNYFYIDAVNEWYNSYGSYAMYFGLDTTKALDKQVYDSATGSTWADSFVGMALDNVKSTYALYDMAIADGHKLSEDEQAEIDGLIDGLENYVSTYKKLYESMGYSYAYKDANDYLQALYGKAATTKTYKAYYEVCIMSSSYYAAHSDSLEYDEAALRAYEADKLEEYNSFTFAYYYFNATAFREGGTKSEDGKTTTYTDEEKEAAIKVAKELADQLAAGTYEDLDAFDHAINDLLTKHFGEDKKEDDKKDEDKKDETSNGTATSSEEDNTGDAAEGDVTEGENTEDDKTEGENTEGDNTEDGKTEDDKTEDDKDDDKEEENLKYKSTRKEDVLYSQLNSLFVDWLIGRETSDEDEKDEDEDKEETFVVRQEGELTVIVSESGSGDKKTVNGYYVLRFGSVNDNNFKLKNVRHLLVAYEGGKTDSNGNKTYTDKEKAAAKLEAEKLLAEFEKSKKTELDFTALVKEHSDDKDAEGNVNNEGLYEDVYPGQMVPEFEEWCYDEERKAGDYELVQTDYGWHIMYFVGDSETTYRDFMIEADLHNEDMTKWMEGLVEKVVCNLLTDKYVNKGLILGSN